MLKKIIRKQVGFIFFRIISPENKNVIHLYKLPKTQVKNNIFASIAIIEYRIKIKKNNNENTGKYT